MEITDEHGAELRAELDISDFFEKEFSMMNGETCEVELLCENKLMSSIIDKFGDDVKTESVDEAHFKAIVDVDLSGNFYGWVFASKGKMRIIAPERVKDEFQSIVDADTRLPHKASDISSTRRTETPARYISIKASSTELSLRR